MFDICRHRKQNCNTSFKKFFYLLKKLSIAGRKFFLFTQSRAIDHVVSKKKPSRRCATCRKVAPHVASCQTSCARVVAASANRAIASPIFAPKELLPRHGRPNATKSPARHAGDGSGGCGLGPIRTNDLVFRSREPRELGTAIAIGRAAPSPAPKLACASIGILERRAP